MLNANDVSLLKYTIGTSMIRYETLDEIFSPLKEYIRSYPDVVFHFELTAALCRCYQSSKNDGLMNSISRMDPNLLRIQLVISILNVVAHYRKYLTFKLRCKNTIVITYDGELSDYQKHYFPELREDRMSKYSQTESGGYYSEFNMAVRDAYRYLQAMCAYFEDIYCIDYDLGVDSATITELVRRDEKYEKSFHILFTRNPIVYQLCDKNTIVLFNKRDKSKILGIGNAIADGIGADQKMSASVKEKLIHIPAKMIPHIIMLGRVAKVSKTVPEFNWDFGDIINVLDILIREKYISTDISPIALIEEIESFIERYLKNREREAKIRKKRKPKHKYKPLNIGMRFQQEMAQQKINEKPKTDMPFRISGKIVITDTVYKKLLERYKACCVPIMAAAVSEPQKLRIHSRMYNLFDQNYLESVNDILSDISSQVDLIELTALNCSDPSQGKTVSEYESKEEW